MKDKIGYYSIIPSRILYNKELKANEKLLYAMITSLACKEGFCFATNNYFERTNLMKQKEELQQKLTQTEEKISYKNKTKEEKELAEFIKIEELLNEKNSKTG